MQKSFIRSVGLDEEIIVVFLDPPFNYWQFKKHSEILLINQKGHELTSNTLNNNKKWLTDKRHQLQE